MNRTVFPFLPQSTQVFQSRPEPWNPKVGAGGGCPCFLPTSTRVWVARPGDVLQAAGQRFCRGRPARSSSASLGGPGGRAETSHIIQRPASALAPAPGASRRVWLPRPRLNPAGRRPGQAGAAPGPLPTPPGPHGLLLPGPSADL